MCRDKIGANVSSQKRCICVVTEEVQPYHDQINAKGSPLKGCEQNITKEVRTCNH